jgi:ribosome-associated toxin RatA of RatAB toxin-antitoxin module
VTVTQQHQTRHSVVVESDVDTAYGVIADTAVWPAVFGPTVHVEQVERVGDRERVHLWATVNGKVLDWISTRVLDRENGRISLEQESPRAPLAAMGGHWEFRALTATTSEVTLHHYFSTVDDTPESTDWVSKALEVNSAAELAALSRALGSGHPVGDILFTFRDSVRVNGSAADAYAFIHDAELWPERLPHVSSLVLTEPAPGVQEMTMETTTPEGGSHTTKSVRVCFAGELITYKQSILPALLHGHSGRWIFSEVEDGALVHAEHTVMLNVDEVTSTLGPDATVATAQEFVRTALGGNSRATLAHAKDFAEIRRA